MPEPDRTIHITAPTLFPPLQLNADELLTPDAYFESAPRKIQLSHHTLLRHPVGIYAIGGFLMEGECREWIEWGERNGFDEAKQKQTVEMAFRDNGRIEFDSAEIAQSMWLRIRPFAPETPSNSQCRALGCSQRIRLYRYVKGQRFGMHVDGSRNEPTLGGRTHITVLVYLNGGDRETAELQVRGGETAFWKDRNGNPTTMQLAFPPTRGVCLLHGHGDECMIHEGALVEDGVKYVLRTDVVYELPR